MGILKTNVQKQLKTKTKIAWREHEFLIKDIIKITKWEYRTSKNLGIIHKTHPEKIFHLRKQISAGRFDEYLKDE